MDIIGVVGYSGSGKNSVAEYLTNEYGYIRVAFADHLKDVASLMFGWDRALLEGDTRESREFREKKDDWWSEKFKKDFTPRLALQLLGTESVRDVFHPDFWVICLERNLIPDLRYVIADTRFPNEIEKIRKLGGKIFRVIRGDEPEWWPTAMLTNSAKLERKRGNMELHHHMAQKNELMENLYPHVHYSEWAWIGQEFDAVIENNGTLEDLKTNVDKVMTKKETTQ